MTEDITSGTLGGVCKRVARRAFGFYDPTMKNSEEVSQVIRFANEHLSDVISVPIWEEPVWAGDDDERRIHYERAWLQPIAVDFLTLFLTPGNEYVTHRARCHARVIARAQLALAIHISKELGYKNIEALVNHQNTVVHKDSLRGEITLHRPPHLPTRQGKTWGPQSFLPITISKEA